MNEAGAGLRHWVNAVWPNLQLQEFSLNPAFHTVGDVAPEWQALSGDAGFRRYFRLASEPPLLAVYAPVATEDTGSFMKIAHHLRRGGVMTPAIAAHDLEHGYLLIEDLGSQLLLDVLDEDNADELYGGALSALQQLQHCPPDPQIFPLYDRDRLRTEMNLFPEWFVGKLLGVATSPAEQSLLEDVFRLLEESALQQPQVVVHRDYHSRNLIHRPHQPPGVIDFQDAVIGPVTYDLVSLLRDCYIAWPREQVQGWALDYAHRLRAAGLATGFDDRQFLRWFDLMGLQRHIKVLGIFARLSLRDNKHSYLNDLPLVVRYTVEVARGYPELANFVEWFDRALQPAIHASAWHRVNPL